MCACWNQSRWEKSSSHPGDVSVEHNRNFFFFFSKLLIVVTLRCLPAAPLPLYIPYWQNELFLFFSPQPCLKVSQCSKWQRKQGAKRQNSVRHVTTLPWTTLYQTIFVMKANVSCAYLRLCSCCCVFCIENTRQTEPGWSPALLAPQRYTELDWGSSLFSAALQAATLEATNLLTMSQFVLYFILFIKKQTNKKTVWSLVLSFYCNVQFWSRRYTWNLQNKKINKKQK